MARPRKTAAKSEYQQRLDEGFTPEQARELVMTKARSGVAYTPENSLVSFTPLEQQTALQRQESVTRGPDPELVARHQAATANLPAPDPNIVLTVELEPRWYDVLTLYTEILRGQRNLPDLTPAQALVQLVRWASASHPDIVLVRTQGKGKAAFVHPSQKAG